MDKTSLPTVMSEQMTVAQQVSSGRGSHTVYGGHEHELRQTLIALSAGEQLDDHVSPGEATVQVLTGRVSVVDGSESCEAVAGDLLVVPDGVHSVEAHEDSALLLTVVKHRPGL